MHVCALYLYAYMLSDLVDKNLEYLYHCSRIGMCESILLLQHVSAHILCISDQCNFME